MCRGFFADFFFKVFSEIHIIEMPRVIRQHNGCTERIRVKLAQAIATVQADLEWIESCIPRTKQYMFDQVQTNRVAAFLCKLCS